MSIQIKVTYDADLKDFADFKKHIRRNAELGADKALDKAVDDLKDTLFKLINEEIKTFDSTAQANQQTSEVPPSMNIPKAKADLVKHIFGQDIKTADIGKATSKNKTVNDNSNVFAIQDRRIKGWQSVGDSSTLNGDSNKFKQRLIDGIIIDSDTGKMYKLNPNDVKGVKLECSKDEGQTLDSEKKFEAYKNSDKISRRKDGPDQRLAVWTVRQEDVDFMMRHAVSIDDIIEKIMEEDYDTATQLLNRINNKGEFNQPLEKIQDLKNNKNLAPDLQAYMAILKLIRNLKIEKKYLKTMTRYTLFSNYDPSLVDKNEKFMDSFRQEINLWLVSNQDDWYKQMVDQVTKGIQQYDSKAKFKE